jgi:protein TonB
MTDFTRPGLSLAVESARGVVLFESFGPRVMTERRDDDIAPVAVLRHRSSGRTTGGSLSFDEAEAMARRDVAPRQGGTVVSTPGGSYSSESFARPGGRAGTPPGDAAVRGPAPMRAGGNIPPPQRIRHVPPAYPPDALAARIQGVVIVEVTIGTDGSVSDARILRSIPLLDAAALDAVRQWKFTPTLLNGQPVPVIMTTTVNFALP